MPQVLLPSSVATPTAAQGTLFTSPTLSSLAQLSKRIVVVALALIAIVILAITAYDFLRRRPAVLQHTPQRILPQMNRNARDQPVRPVNHEAPRTAIAAIPADQRDAAAICADRLITEGMTQASRKSIVEAIATIPSAERDEVVRNAVLLITPDMHYYDKIDMIQAVARVPMNQRDATTALALRVITPGMSHSSRQSILKAVAAIPSAERDEVVRNAVLLITPDMYYYDRIDMIQAVARVPMNERDATTALALRIITRNMSVSSRQSILEAVAAIPALEREEVVRNAVLLITPEIYFYDRIDMIQAVARVPMNQRDATTALALRIITRNMGVSSRQSILEAVAAFRPLEREEVVRNAVLLISREMSVYDRLDIILLTALHIPVNERDAIVALALQVITPDMGVSSKEVIVDAIAALPAPDRANVIQHALQLINPQMFAHDRAMIIQNVALVPIGRRADYVQERRHGRQAHQNARVAAQQGINVHEGDRDQRLKAAIELFYQRQGQLPKARIDEAVQKFTQYLNSFQMNAEHKRLAQRALLAPRSPDEPFGPLIGGDDFSVLGLVISGQELVGRLWIFASALAEPDQTNAKNSMISALKDSYLMGARVCNQGKAQRLVIGVLQGRLAGVDIELRSEMQIPTRQAVETFFQVPAHKNIDKLAPLVDAANRFCDQNPAVNRDAFLREIRDYATASGFEN